MKPLTMIWHYCQDGRNLPETNKGKLCIFKRGDRVEFEICVLIEDVFQPDAAKYWVIKGSAEQKTVYPFAWLEIDKDIPAQWLQNLAIAKNFVITY